ncbi:unnamed protein product [Macrosiphum euphorbiae]|uniref:Nephrin n=1 Tax=Macrosiphum euphorbiae TaxID=13131 RepID=A0AAV0WN67_9HEMI|nr:unnamed protein product [Macrosiphum euphorbiae]
MHRCSRRTCSGRRIRRNPLRSFPQIGLLLLLFSCLRVTTFKQQKFRVEPKNVNAREGSNVTLLCEIDDLTGDVQWTKDGLALGYAAEIPGHPRHSMMTDPGNGVYNLLVRNVTITDDALYQCQVSPGPAAGSKPIRSSATLSVLTPPSSVEIINTSEGSKLEVQENHEVSIECIVRNSKPASRIVWFRGDEEINPEQRSDNEIEETADETRSKLFTVRSRIKVTAKSNDDRVKYKCEAHHQALSDPLSTTVQIRVLYPPGVPHIEGYTEGDILEKGQHVSLRCVSRNGNPPSQLVWFKNGQLIHNDYSTTEKVSESTYSFIANVSDNSARFRCEAKNSISPLPQYADVVLSVSFGPSHVRIRGPDEGKQGDLITLSCETGRSNPAALIKWTVAGEPEENSTSTNVPAPQSSWITKSNVSFVIPTGQRYVVATCQSISNSVFDKVIDTHKISILHPPGAPIIIDHSSGNPIPSGNVQKISCLSTGGNPLASVAWFKNDKKVHSIVTTGENSVSAELAFVVNYTDNDATYKCEVTHPALTVPLMKTQKLKVLFLPDHLNIKHDPVHLKPGDQATLTCEATSSNPALKMSWWHQGVPVSEGINSYTKPGLHGGKLSTIQMTFNVTPEVDGSLYMCQGSNPLMSKNIHKEVTLDVYHKPTFDSYPDLMTYTEGDNVFVTLQAKGRPSQITYKWFKNNKLLYSLHNRRVQDSHINFTGIFRDDAGNYTCEARNTEGFSTFSFIISVRHRATITNTSSGVIVSEGHDAQLWCRIDGFPLGPDHISWTRPNFFFDERTSILLKNTTSYLTILNATQFDSGLFYCVVNNGIGNESSHSVMLIVEHKPEILTTENESKTASNAGMSAKLHCRAVGAPMIRFSWERDGSNITSVSEKYIVEQKRLNETFYESTLTILQVDQFNYGDYVCTASNNLGRTTSVNRLTVFSHPDPPSNFRLANATHNRVMLTWSPGFDGGDPVTYRIRYRASDSKMYLYEDLGNETHHTVSGLEPLKSYLFSIMARNLYGDSSYVSQSIKVTTTKENVQPKSDSNADKPAEDQGMRIVFTFLGVFGGVLIIVSIFIVSYCIHRRRNVNKQISNENNDSSSKTPTIEMYAPNTYNGGYDENLSSISAKSETYSNVSPDYNDDQQQKSAEQSYLIEQIDYPFINDCDHPLQPHVQYGGGLSMSSDQSVQHYNMHENTNDRRNIENRTSHLHHHHHLHHLHHLQQHQQQQQQQQQQQHQLHHHQPQQHHHQQPHHALPGVPTARAVPLPPILHNRPVPPPTIPPMVSKLNYYSPPPPPPPPPDVTVFSSQNVLTTFAHKPDETEGHLV